MKAFIRTTAIAYTNASDQFFVSSTRSCKNRKIFMPYHPTVNAGNAACYECARDMCCRCWDMQVHARVSMCHGNHTWSFWITNEGAVGAPSVTAATVATRAVSHIACAGATFLQFLVNPMNLLHGEPLRRDTRIVSKRMHGFQRVYLLLLITDKRRCFARPPILHR